MESTKGEKVRQSLFTFWLDSADLTSIWRAILTKISKFKIRVFSNTLSFLKSKQSWKFWTRANLTFKMAPRQVTSTKFLAKKLEKMKAKFDPPLDINGPATLTISSKTERHIELLEKYSEIAQKDPIKAMIEIEKDLETLTLVRNHIWRKEWKNSPHLLPKYAKNWF